MGGVSENLVFPTIEQVVHVNRRMIETSGGSFTHPNNFHNRDSLEYILEAIAYPLFGKDIYPSVVEKAAALGCEIIKSHVFLDGNKRTGTYMVWSFLISNNKEIRLENSIINIIEGIAEGKMAQSELIEWINAH